MINYKKFSENGKAPQFGREDDAGYDLFAAESGYVDCYISAGGGPTTKTISLDIGIEIPKGHWGLCKERSGHARDFGLFLIGGVIDNSYTGCIKVILANTGNQRFYFEKGDKIAQIMILPYLKMPMQEVKDLAKTDRGEKGFGSSGIK